MLCFVFIKNQQINIRCKFVDELFWIVCCVHSLTSPYGHVSAMDSSYGPRDVKKHTFPTSLIWTPLKRTIGSVPLVSVLKRFDCTFLWHVSLFMSKVSLAWSQFLEFFTLNKAVLPFLRKEHHNQRVGVTQSSIN